MKPLKVFLVVPCGALSPEDGERLGGGHVALDHEEGGHDGRRARVAQQAVHKHLQTKILVVTYIWGVPPGW